MSLRHLWFVAPILLSTFPAWSLTSDFEDVSLSSNGFYNGADLAGGFTTRDVFFANDYDIAFDAWSGFAYSNHTDTTTPGFANQYSAFAGSGAGGSAQYGIGFVSSPGFGIPAQATFPGAATPQSIAITNTTYAAISMRDGDAFAKKFGGTSGDDPDFLRLTIIGETAQGSSTGSIDVFLADYRFTDNRLDFILEDWLTVDLTPLGEVHALRFDLETTDIGPFGPNTPFYFAVDQLQWEPVPEPAVAVGGGLTAAAFFVWRRRKPRAMRGCSSLNGEGRESVNVGDNCSPRRR